jgi:hypothetical protein
MIQWIVCLNKETMNNLNEIYQTLIEYFSEIITTEVWDFPETEESISVEYDVLFNGKNKSAFLDDIDRITYKISNKLSEIEDSSNDMIIEIDSIINKLSNELISKKSFINTDKIDGNSIPIINALITEVVEKLHKHKNAWNVKNDAIGNIPGNFPLPWNENINKLVDIFSQLAELKNADKEPLIITSKINLAKFITNNFVDRKGKNLKFETVYTNLKKPEKRPISDKRIEIRYFPA